MSAWKNHTTDSIPVDPKVWVDVMRFDGSVDYAIPARGWNWSRSLLQPYVAGPSNHGIAAYRICAFQPQAGE